MGERPLSARPTSPSSRSSGSLQQQEMVEISIPPAASSTGAAVPPARLLWSKSHVYVHPTPFSAGNVCGYVSIVEQTGPKKILLSWLPQTLAERRVDYDAFVRADSKDGTLAGLSLADEPDYVLVEPIPERGESHAFSVPLHDVYSIIAYPPSLSKWHGSLTINLDGGQTLPTLHFHDDESASTVNLLSGAHYPPATATASYPPPPSWGGEELLHRLRTYCNLLRSSLEPNLFLVDPNKQDLELHTSMLFDDSAVDDILSPVPANRRPRPAGHAASDPTASSSRTTFPPASAIHPARTNLLSTFSKITRAATNISSEILSHPSIAPHLPQPVKTLIHADAPQFTKWSDLTGTGEFESARVYLARWARLVAEEGERNKRSESPVVGTGPSAAHGHPVAAGSSSSEGDLGVWEVLRFAKRLGLEDIRTTRVQGRSICQDEWASFWDAEGSPVKEEKWIRGEVFRRGLEPSVRKEAWPFLLGVVPFKSTASERAETWAKKRVIYEGLRASKTLDGETRAQADVAEEIHRIHVDCRRTDRNHPMFEAARPLDGAPTEDETGRSTNPNVDKLAEILLTYGHFDSNELGYAQGMSDLMAPLYVIQEGDDVRTFWCFVEYMEQMKQNFFRDQSGMKQQLSTLRDLISVLDPQMFAHLEKTESLNLFFCFRWILIAFKREFDFDDVVRLWEVLFTQFYSRQFLLFVAMAVLHSHRDVILRYLSEFDELLKYCNELSGTIDLQSTLNQAEVLFLSFRSLVEDVDRRQALREEASNSKSIAGGSLSEERGGGGGLRLRRKEVSGSSPSPSSLSLLAPAAAEAAGSSSSSSHPLAAPSFSSSSLMATSSGEQIDADEDFAIPHLPVLSSDLRALLDSLSTS